MPAKLTQKDFLKRSRKAHGHRFDYSLSQYTGLHNKVTVVCPKHGPFYPRAHVHMNGYDCPSCSIEKSSSKNSMGMDEFVRRSRKTHGDKYGYPDNGYVNNHTPVSITCPQHGDFSQLPMHHVKGHGCPRCGYGTFSGSNNPKYVRAEKEFVERAIKIHGDRYDYSKFVYGGSNAKGIIVCPEHGEFEQSYNNHVNMKNGCPKCNDNVSGPEGEVLDFVKSLLPDDMEIFQSDRKLIYPYELDIVIPELKTAVEFNGTYWHSEKYKRPGYHRDKTERCGRKGYRLLHIDEYMWKSAREKIKYLIRAKLGYFEKTLYARKCEVVEISKKEADGLCDKVHMNGSCRSGVRFGLKYGGTLVGVATFGKPRFNKKFDWEILRVCFMPGFRVIGGVGKLWAAFVKKYCDSGDRVISYANRYWSDGGLYCALGFQNTGSTEPNYVWVHKTGSACPVPRYRTQKHKLPDFLGNGFDPDKSESENMRDAGYLKFYDAGNLRFEKVI